VPPVPRTSGRRLTRRLVQLYAGLVLYGISMAMLIKSRLGNMPWDVLHQGLAHHLGWSLGTVTVVVGAAVLLCWIPLRERPGLGTVSNVVVIGIAVDAALAVIPCASCSPPAASRSTPPPPRSTSACASVRVRATA